MTTTPSTSEQPESFASALAGLVAATRAATARSAYFQSLEPAEPEPPAAAGNVVPGEGANPNPPSNSLQQFTDALQERA